MLAPIQDYIVLCSIPSPGICKISGAGSPRGWDERKGYGADGAYLVLVSLGLASFTVTLTLWEDAHFLAWDAFAALLEKPKNLIRPRALGISHPLLEAAPLRIKDVIVEDVSQFEQDDDDELWTCEIKFRAYRPPKPILAKPMGAVPGVTPTVPSAQDAADAEIQKLLAEAKTLLP